MLILRVEFSGGEELSESEAEEESEDEVEDSSSLGFVLDFLGLAGGTAGVVVDLEVVLGFLA